MRRLHVIPSGDFGPQDGIHAASMACWCHPLALDGGVLAVHNAKESRESRQRRALDHSATWVMVAEELPPTRHQGVGEGDDGLPYV